MNVLLARQGIFDYSQMQSKIFVICILNYNIAIGTLERKKKKKHLHEHIHTHTYTHRGRSKEECFVSMEENF